MLPSAKCKFSKKPFIEKCISQMYVKQPEMDWCILSPVWKQFLLLCSLHTWKINWREKRLKCRCQIWWMLNCTLTPCAWFWILISLLILLVLHHTENVEPLPAYCSEIFLYRLSDISITPEAGLFHCEIMLHCEKSQRNTKSRMCLELVSDLFL